jgi:hypothetical protein
MSRNLLKLFPGDIRTAHGARLRILRLFYEIEDHHGTDETRRLFAERTKKPSKRELAERKEHLLLQRFDAMPVPNVMELARDIVAENKTLPPDEQLTPRGSTSEATITHYIRELLRKRKAAIADGTWAGPPWWPDDRL